MDLLKIGGRDFSSRLFVGTGKFPSNKLMLESIIASGSEMITVAMKRIDMQHEEDDDMMRHINRDKVQFLPNTSGVRNAEEAILAAKLSRDCFGTDFIKLEIHPDPKYLLPDPIETLKATEVLAREGFVVLPYIQADPVLCKRLEEVGSAAVMPLGAPIGTNKGLKTRDLLEIIIAESRVPVTCSRRNGDGCRCRTCEHRNSRCRQSGGDGRSVQARSRSRAQSLSRRTRQTKHIRASNLSPHLVSRLGTPNFNHITLNYGNKQYRCPQLSRFDKDIHRRETPRHTRTHAPHRPNAHSENHKRRKDDA